MGGSVFSTTLTEDSPNFNMIMKETEGYLDKVIIGEGEDLFTMLLRDELPKDQRIFSLKNLGMEGQKFSEKTLPDYSDFDIKLYPYMAATGSKSCPYKCSFCNSRIYFGKYTKKDVKQTVREMQSLYELYGNQLFYLSDSLLNPIVTDLANEIIESPVKLYYDAFHRVDEATYDIKNTLLWRKGGFYRARLGVESGSQRILDLMDKRITVEQTRSALSALAYAGIKTTTYWVIGHPGETEEDFQMTLDLIRELKNDIYQAEPAPLEYVYSGQSNSKEWKKKGRLLYPERMSKELLHSYVWVIGNDPSRETVLRRIYEFDNLLKSLGIPNPYSLEEHFKADERWKRLHKNAVPSLLRFYNREEYVDDTADIKLLNSIANSRVEEDSFNF